METGGVMSFDYLGTQITACQYRINEVKLQAIKASQISGEIQENIRNDTLI